MLTKFGLSNIIIMLASSIIIILIGLYINKLWVSLPMYVFGALLIIFTFIFFRDPERIVPDDAKKDISMVIAPADGKIVEIVEESENIFLKGNSKRISIFLSPLDVHVNRLPVSGIVKYFEYIPGKYLVAYHPKSSIKNEQTHIGVANSAGKIFFKQIVGMVARRLTWDIKEGDTVNVGQRFGMMKFGSRMDIAISVNSEIFVKVGDRVVAGETIIAKMK